MLSRTFEVLPGFAYYRDTDGMNARATPAVMLDRTDGTVMFGLGLLEHLLARPSHGDAAVVAVCAHEFGHIIAYKLGLQQRLISNGSPFRGEQFADFIAGYFAGLRKLERPDFPAVAFATTQRSFGGSVRGTHGTGVERAAAVEAGFAAAYRDRMDSSSGINVGYQYAMSV